MKVRYRVAIEIVVVGKDKKEIASNFGELDLGGLQGEIMGYNPGDIKIHSFEYIETECCNLVEEDGSIGEEISIPKDY